MDQKLPTAADHARLGLITGQWRDWQPRPARQPEVVSRLAGFSNDNYLVAADEHRFVVRLNNDSYELGVDRLLERQILTDIAGAEFAPRLAWWSEHSLVTGYIPAPHPADPEPQLLGELFRQIHGTAVSPHPPLDPYEHLENYFHQLDSVPANIAAGYEALLATRPTPSGDLCLCHHDLLLGNVLAGDGSAIVIDWEYARLGDPAFDIAIVAHTYGYDDSAVAELLRAYGGGADLQERIRHYRGLYSLVEICWWLLRGQDAASLTAMIDNALAQIRRRPGTSVS